MIAVEVQKFPCNDIGHTGVCGTNWSNIIERFETYNGAKTEFQTQVKGSEETNCLFEIEHWGGFHGVGKLDDDLPNQAKLMA